MADAIRIICSLLLAGVLSLGCSDDDKAGCFNQQLFTDEACLDAGTCPACDSVCAVEEGTALGAPECIQQVGFGLYCACQCEFCVGGASPE